MATSATIAAKLTLNSKGFQQGIDQAISKAERFKSKMGAIGKKVTQIGGTMTAGLTVPIIGAGVAMVNAASDLKESAGAVETIFGDASKAVLEFSDTAATSVALSSAQFNQLAAVSGSLLQNLGYDADQAGLETIKLTERAADMAAVFNTDVSQALEAIQSGLKGEMNPLEQFGVKLNMASVKAKALAMGLGETTVDLVKLEKAQIAYEKSTAGLSKAIAEFGENSLEARDAASKQAVALRRLDKALEGDTGKLTDYAKAQAVLAIIMEQTERISGTFAKEQDGVAGSIKTLKAQIRSQAEILGQELLPYVAKAVNYFRDLTVKFSKLSPEQKRVILGVLGIVAAVGPLLLILGTLITSVGSVVGVIGTLAGGGGLLALLGPLALVGVAVGGLWHAWEKNLGNIQERVESFVYKVRNSFEHLFEAGAFSSEFGESLTLFFGEAAQDTIFAIQDKFEKFFKETLFDKINIKEIFSPIFEKIKTVFEDFISSDFGAAGAAAMTAVLPVIFGPLGMIGSTIIRTITGGGGIDLSKVLDSEGLQKAKDKALEVFDAIKEGFSKIKTSGLGGKLAVLWAVLKTGFIVVKSIAISIGQALGPSFKAFWEALKKNLPAVQQLFQKWWGIIKPILTVLGVILLVVLSVVVGVFRGIMDSVGMAMPYIIGFFDAIYTFIGGVINVVKGFGQIITGIFTLDWDMFKEGWVTLATGAGEIVEGLWGAIKNATLAGIYAVIGLVFGFVTGIYEFFKNLFDQLVGHSLIPDMLNAIVLAFVNFIKNVVERIKLFMARLKTLWTVGLAAIKFKFQQFKNLIIGYVTNLIERMKILWTVGLAAIKWKIQEFKNNIIMKMEELMTTLRNKWSNGWENLKSVAGDAADWLKNKIISVFSAIKDAITGLIGKLANLKEKFNGLKGLKDLFGGLKLPDMNNMKLPSWLTPGSPTPLELGLKGINKEMGTLGKMNMPTLQSAAPVNTSTSGGGSTQINIEVNNPLPRSTEESVNRELKKLSYLGVLA